MKRQDQLIHCSSHVGKRMFVLSGKGLASKELHALTADFTVWVLFKACILPSFTYASDKIMCFKRLHGFVYKNSKTLSIT